MSGLDDHTPAQMSYDLLAEQSLLKIAMGGDALALQLCGDLITSFWSGRHKLLAALLHGMGRSEQYVDAVSVMGQVTAQGLITKLPGPFLHSVMSGPGDHAGVMWYADRIREMAGRRQLTEAAQRLMQKMEWGWSQGDDLDTAAALAEFRTACDVIQASLAPTEQGGPQSLAEFLDGPTEEDWLVPGLLERGERIILTGTEGGGKAIKTDIPVATVRGWSTMGGLSVGDEIFAPDGSVTRVVAATEVMHDRPCYRITFSDGAELVADAGHLWLTETLKAREAAAKEARRGPTKLRGTDQRRKRVDFPAVVTTEHVATTLMARDGHAVNHSVVCCSPLDPPRAALPIDPYLLGVWLGDGTTLQGSLTLNREDAPPIEQRIGRPSRRVPSAERPECVGVRVPGFTADLRDAGFLGYKHIPTAYMRASAEQRWELLAGLMDTDGHIAVSDGQGRGHGAASCELTLCDKQLAADALELLWSLGIKVTSHESDAFLDGRVVGRRWRMKFQTSRNPFLVPRKADRWRPLRTRRASLRYITSVEPVESVPVRCIQVDRPDGMFLVGRECIPTHNSVLCSQLTATMAGSLHPFSGAVLGHGDRGIRVTVFDCENSAVQSRRRYRWITRKVDQLRRSRGLGPVDWKAQAFIDIRPEGVDLLKTRSVAHLEHVVAATAPDLLVIGPLYKMFNADPSDEPAVREVSSVLDGLRARHRFALLIEAHSGKGMNAAGTSRRMEPIGSSLWQRWPEYGFGLARAKGAKRDRAELVDVVSWRGSREERQWPSRLRYGSELPWEPVAEARGDELVEDEPELERDPGWYL